MVEGRILVVDDERNIRRSLDLILAGQSFEVREAANGEDALARVDDVDFDAVFLDLHLPGVDGMEVLRRLRQSHPQLPVIVISGHATIDRAVEATRLGAFDFLEKPFSRERVLLLARNATESARLRRENRRLRASEGEEILGESLPMLALKEAIARVAPTEARVLILGESGTGKELVARALHRQSPRAARPFVRVNCAAIPEELIEAELFGAVKGAYTGATTDRAGRFEAADGGTILLDEIGDMSLRAQVKVLRVLQEGEFEPVGSTRTLRVDVRVLAATHQDLGELVRAGRFREDLLYRLNVIPIEVPPLRARSGDVSRLVEAFLEHYARVHELACPQVSPAALALLERHTWPGNIRELKNVAERLVILRRSGRIEAGDLPAEIRGPGGARGGPGWGKERTGVDGVAGAGAASNPYGHLPLREAKDALERDLIHAALARHEGNVTRAAESLGLERTHLHKRMKALGLRDRPGTGRSA